MSSASITPQEQLLEHLRIYFVRLGFEVQKSREKAQEVLRLTQSEKTSTPPAATRCNVNYPHPAHDGCDGSPRQPWPFPLEPSDRIYTKEDAEGLCAIAVTAYRKAAIIKAVDRFLGWRLPKDFSPDAGIVFTPPSNEDWWPVGTNLLTADQAASMLEHILAPLPSASPNLLGGKEDNAQDIRQTPSAIAPIDASHLLDLLRDIYDHLSAVDDVGYAKFDWQWRAQAVDHIEEAMIGLESAVGAIDSRGNSE